MIKLSTRLEAIAKLVPKNTIVADIGTDHALLPCYLIEQAITEEIYACDINQGPLEHAKETVQKYGYSDRITTILSAGLEKVPTNIETLIIAGMGFETIKLILENEVTRFTKLKTLLLQSNTDLPLLRLWITEYGYQIDEEVLVHDGFYYHILKCSKGVQVLNEIQQLYGVNIKQRDLHVQELNRRKLHLQGILSKMPEQAAGRAHFLNELELINKII